MHLWATDFWVYTARGTRLSDIFDGLSLPMIISNLNKLGLSPWGGSTPSGYAQHTHTHTEGCAARFGTWAGPLYCSAVPGWPSYCSGPGWHDTGEWAVSCLRKWPIVPPCRPVSPSCQAIVLTHSASPSCQAIVLAHVPAHHASPSCQPIVLAHSAILSSLLKNYLNLVTFSLSNV